ncbi:NB-ARC domain-containing protein [Nonomuraea endophytica]|uniref:NB-ARC domain-containing protein n=1 Tax=Nonomuraea endophytica TaxID=714136 RepID=UPI0037C711CB
MAVSSPDAPPPRRRWRGWRVLVLCVLAVSLLLVLAGAVVFFLADPLGLPDGLLEVLDRRASVASMLVGLVGLGLGGAGLWLQFRPPGAAPAGPAPAPAVSTSGAGSPAVGVMSGGVVVGLVEGSAQVSGPGSVHTHVHSEGAGSVGVGGHNYGTTGGRYPPPPPLARALAGLPAAPPDFTGRGEILAELQDALDPGRAGAGTAGSGGTAVVVSAVAGMAGVGKTALALVAAHHALRKHWFAGGVFFCDLHGYTPGAGEPGEASAAAGQVLRAMGLRPEELLATAVEVLAVYRSVLADLARAGRGVLVVADNAADTGQVQALIPAQACHRLLVTSRHTLPLAGRQFDLDVLKEGEAVELLRTALAVRRAADRRVEAEPDAAAELVRLGGWLPLAVQIIAALLAAELDRPLSAMAVELADAGERLNVMQVEGQEAGCWRCGPLSICPSSGWPPGIRSGRGCSCCCRRHPGWTSPRRRPPCWTAVRRRWCGGSCASSPLPI